MENTGRSQRSSQILDSFHAPLVRVDPRPDPVGSILFQLPRVFPRSPHLHNPKQLPIPNAGNDRLELLSQWREIHAGLFPRKAKIPSGSMAGSPFPSLAPGLQEFYRTGIAESRIPNPWWWERGRRDGIGAFPMNLRNLSIPLGMDQDGHSPGDSILPETSCIHQILEGIFGIEQCQTVCEMHGSRDDPSASGISGNGVGNVWWSFSCSPIPRWDIKGWNFPLPPIPGCRRAGKAGSSWKECAFQVFPASVSPALERFQGWRSC